MKFHWMEIGQDTNVDRLKVVSNIIDNFKYESILLVYHSKLDDNWIKAARALDTNHSFKYMPAVRTYSISPEYCAMICKAFASISKDRLMLNIVSGDIHSDETSVDDLIWISKDLDTPEKRLNYTDEWLSKFIDLVGNELPGIVMAGHSSKTKSMAEKYGAIHLAMLNMHKQRFNSPDFIKNTKQMLSLGVIINDSQDEIEKLLGSYGWSRDWTIYGTKEEVKKQMLDLKELGATDLMIRPHPEDKNLSLIHEIVLEMIKEQNGIK
jgi:alkanesulfonate monooxygenase SsuD/methylene tetrahydromethanopterin reductase-like flavin-dependent oxidoreductase (luciferase family)